MAFRYPWLLLAVADLGKTGAALGSFDRRAVIDKMAALALLAKIGKLSTEGTNINVRTGVQVNTEPVTDIKVAYIDAPQGMDVEEGVIENGVEFKPLTEATQSSC
jgi:hypothetical protein